MTATPLYDAVVAQTGINPKAKVQVPTVTWSQIPKRQRTKLVKDSAAVMAGVR